MHNRFVETYNSVETYTAVRLNKKNKNKKKRIRRYAG